MSCPWGHWRIMWPSPSNVQAMRLRRLNPRLREKPCRRPRSKSRWPRCPTRAVAEDWWLIPGSQDKIEGIDVGFAQDGDSRTLPANFPIIYVPDHSSTSPDLRLTLNAIPLVCTEIMNSPFGTPVQLSSGYQLRLPFFNAHIIRAILCHRARSIPQSLLTRARYASTLSSFVIWVLLKYPRLCIIRLTFLILIYSDSWGAYLLPTVTDVQKGCYVPDFLE
jgi:hypothetical protein